MGYLRPAPASPGVVRLPSIRFSCRFPCSRISLFAEFPVRGFLFAERLSWHRASKTNDRIISEVVERSNFRQLPEFASV